MKQKSYCALLGRYRRAVNNTHGEYKGAIYLIGAVDFAEALLGLRNPLGGDRISWVRCENVKLIPTTDGSFFVPIRRKVPPAKP